MASLSSIDPDKQRRFALDVLTRLRESGFVAYWAGGCVRDQLLGRVPNDYDVATNAQPREIRGLFGRRRTVAVGAAFGVIVVLGPPGAGQVEVATFRRDREYQDGRRPVGVDFSDPREDALRRDFTINGLFYDPLEDNVIDYTGGVEDLRRRLIRAIGDPRHRFAEDKLRLIRAVRFAATFEFDIETATYRAVVEMAPQLNVVSVERITDELVQILLCPQRCRALELLRESGLLPVVAPELVPEGPTGDNWWRSAMATLARLHEPTLPVALAAWMADCLSPVAAQEIARRWRLPNQCLRRVRWLLENAEALLDAPNRRWSQIQPVLAHPGASELIALCEARAGTDPRWGEALAWCRHQLELPRERLDPPALIDGNDLARHGIPPGPVYRSLLEAVREAQLDGQLADKESALRWVERWLADRGEGVSDGRGGTASEPES